MLPTRRHARQWRWTRKRYERISSVIASASLPAEIGCEEGNVKVIHFVQKHRAGGQELGEE